MADNIFYKVVVKLMDENNNVTEYTYGDTDGSQRTFHLYWDTSKTKPDVEKFGKDQLDKLKYTGYKGSFVTFGEPYVTHGDIVKLTSDKMPERDGNYLVKEVKRGLGIGGSRQEIFIEQKSLMEEIKDAIRALSRTGNEASFILCTVESVDSTKKTCVCEPVTVVLN